MEQIGNQAATACRLAASATLLRRHAERVLYRQCDEDAMVAALGEMVDGLPPDALQSLVTLAASPGGGAVGAALRSQIHAAAVRCSEEQVAAQDGRRAHLFALPMAIAGPERPRHRSTALAAEQLAAIARALGGAQLAPDAEVAVLPWLLSAHEAVFLSLGEVHLFKQHLCAGRPAAAMQALAMAAAQQHAATRAHVALVEQTELRLRDHVVLLVGIARRAQGAAAPFPVPALRGGTAAQETAEQGLAHALGCALELLKPAAAWSANVPGCSALPRAMSADLAHGAWKPSAGESLAGLH